MSDHIVSVSERGQITIPKSFRDKIQVKHFIFEVHDETILLKPLQTREDFLEELEAAEKDWEKQGGITLAEMKKKYKL